MWAILSLLLFVVTPAVLWFRGGRLLGRQTHPAALFILAWMLCALLLGSVGPTALLWVVMNFAVFAVVGKIRRWSSRGSGAG